MSANSSKKHGNSSSGTLGRRRVQFVVEADPGSQVSVAGSFNGWDPDAHLLKEKGKGGRFERTVYLKPGNYQYKFVINGAWSADPQCPHFTSNDFGTLNSLLNVKGPNQRERVPAQASA
jgi:1,4-alpha-glucan branching enzyme